MRMLALLHIMGEGIEELPVKTIYPPDGRVSYHRPFRDSVRIWFGLLFAAVGLRLWRPAPSR